MKNHARISAIVAPSARSDTRKPLARSIKLEVAHAFSSHTMSVCMLSADLAYGMFFSKTSVYVEKFLVHITCGRACLDMCISNTVVKADECRIAAQLVWTVQKHVGKTMQKLVACK